LRKIFIRGVICMLLAAAFLFSYDTSPAEDIIIPECIWAPATGGGTWVTELQIIDMTGGTQVTAYYYTGTTMRSVAIWNSPGIWHSVKFSNILSYMASVDTGFTYYGTVGALWLVTQDSSHLITAQARTVNGNYGKTYPGLQWIDGNTANLDREMVISDLVNNSTYRTFVGFFNAISGGYSMTVEFRIIDANNNIVGSSFSKTFSPWEFKSFNPFVEAGVGSGTYNNCWLWINPTSSGNSGSGTRGLFCFGSSANNNTNDTYAHIATQFTD